MNIKQNEIYMIQFFPKVGDEITKIRPAMVVSSDNIGKLKLKTVVPITDWKEQYKFYPWMIKIVPNPQNGLKKVSAIDTFQIKNLSIDRFKDRVGEIDNVLGKAVHQTILKTFNPRYSIL